MLKQMKLAALIFIAGATVTQAEPMTGADIKATISGQAFEARRMGMRVKINYQSNGKVTLSSALFSGEGTWRTSGDQLCVNITKGPRKGENCVSLDNLGNGKYEASDGATLKAIQ